MPRPIRLPAALCALIVCAGLAPAAASAGTNRIAHAATICGLDPKLDVSAALGGGYYTGLIVKGTNCAGGRRVEAAFQACRVKHGLSGRCTSKVLGFKCTDTRRKADINQQHGVVLSFGAKVACKNAGKTVTYSFTQNVQ